MTQESSPKRTWFLKDEPLTNLEGQDRFSHDAYVNLLSTTVDEVDPPFTLGVFGSWGVGKSSIVNDFSNRVRGNGPKTRAVTIDVWKYSDDSLRRQFLFDLQQSLHNQKALPKDKDYVREVYQEESEERPGEQRLSLGRLRTLAVPLILTALVTAFALGILQFLDFPKPMQAILAALVAPFALYFVAEFTRKVVVVSKDTITRPVYFSEDQFERKFEEIVNDAKCTKLVIIVDNLDRCSHELVVDTLSAIKTFLEPRGEQKCIFVVPCDDGAIRQHVKAAYRVLSEDYASGGSLDPEQYAIEYLRKFFSGSIRIDPFLPEEIESYIEHLLSQMKLTEDLSNQDISTLVQMVGFLFRDNPRQLKQFLNNLTSTYLLVKERETGLSPQINPPISDKKLFLAKVVAIETRFPDLYRMFRNDDNLFPRVHSASVTASRVGEVTTLLSNKEGLALLESFLRSTGHITAANPKAFFNLKQSAQEALIPNYAQFDSALQQGDVASALNAYRAGNLESNNARTDILIRVIEEWSQRNYESYVLNAIQVAVALVKAGEVEWLSISSEIVRIMATYPVLHPNIDQIRDPNTIFEMTMYALPEHRRVIQDAYIECYSNGLEQQTMDSDLKDSIAKSLVAHVGDLTSVQKDLLRYAISASDVLRPVHLQILSSTPEAIEALIEPAPMIKAISSLRNEDLVAFSSAPDQENEYDPTFSVLISCQAKGNQALAEETAERLLELFRHADNTANNELKEYTCHVASNLGVLLRLAEPNQLDMITPYVSQHYYSVEPERKVKVVELMCRYYEQATDSTRCEIDAILLSDFIPLLPAPQISGLLALHQDPDLAKAPWEQMSDRLVNRLVTEGIGADDLLTSVKSALVPDDLEFLMTNAKKILDRYNTRSVVTLVGQLVAELPKNDEGKCLATPVFSSTLRLDGHLGASQNKKLLLEFAFQHHGLHTKGFREQLDDHILDLIVEGDAKKQIGLEALETGLEMGALSYERCLAILHRYAEWLVQQSVASSLQPPILHWLDDLVSLTATLPDGDGLKREVMHWLSGRQEDSLRYEERQQTLGHLVSFGQLPEEILQKLVSKLVIQVQNLQDEAALNTSVGTLLSLYRHNDPLNQELWLDLHDCRRTLLNGNEIQKRAGSRLERQMQKIHLDAQDLLGD